MHDRQAQGVRGWQGLACSFQRSILISRHRLAGSVAHRSAAL
jgi:hypothetical protein